MSIYGVSLMSRSKNNLNHESMVIESSKMNLIQIAVVDLEEAIEVEVVTEVENNKDL
jgi:hypothetical protein